MSLFKKKLPKCTLCHGDKKIYAVPGEIHPAYTLICPRCKGTGNEPEGGWGMKKMRAQDLDIVANQGGENERD